LYFVGSVAGISSYNMDKTENGADTDDGSQVKNA